MIQFIKDYKSILLYPNLTNSMGNTSDDSEDKPHSSRMSYMTHDGIRVGNNIRGLDANAAILFTYPGIKRHGICKLLHYIIDELILLYAVSHLLCIFWPPISYMYLPRFTTDINENYEVAFYSKEVINMIILSSFTYLVVKMYYHLGELYIYKFKLSVYLTSSELLRYTVRDYKLRASFYGRMLAVFGIFFYVLPTLYLLYKCVVLYDNVSLLHSIGYLSLTLSTLSVIFITLLLLKICLNQRSFLLDRNAKEMFLLSVCDVVLLVNLSISFIIVKIY